jgi:hypothetical protein
MGLPNKTSRLERRQRLALPFLILFYIASRWLNYRIHLKKLQPIYNIIHSIMAVVHINFANAWQQLEQSTQRVDWGMIDLATGY